MKTKKTHSISKSILLFILIGFTSGIFAQSMETKTSILNGQDFTDINGTVITAHGGGFLKVGDYYYWLGENRKNGVFVSCYRSKDLMNWEFRADLLTRESNPALDRANIERPKVIYNEKTKKYIMWMHYEYGRDYSYARAAVAFSDNIEKPFTFLKSFRPFENMSRDCTLYKDEDGTAYFLSAARENYDMMLYKLTDDYLDAKEQIATLWPGGHREAPALVKRGDYYFLMTSGCTGWTPNQGKYAYAKSILGPWSDLKDIGNSTTYDSQSTFILPIKGNKKTNYLYVGDRWDGKKYSNSTYIFLPLTFENDSTMELKWMDKISPNVQTGMID
ncbi:MAG: family 43 glycosylhydrolase [Paludibacter sp.]|jgi:beta-xylosidase|nr:family 43 glycosylhydrolase [Paludibacter sp.]